MRDVYVYNSDFSKIINKDSLNRNFGYLGAKIWDNKPNYYKNPLEEKENYLKTLNSSGFDNNKDNLKIPYDFIDYHKSLNVMDAFGCKVLTKEELEELDELLSALDSLIEDDTTRKVLEKLKKKII